MLIRHPCAVGEAVGSGAEVLGSTRMGSTCHEHTGGISSLRHLGEQSEKKGHMAFNDMGFSGKRLELREFGLKLFKVLVLL